MHSVASGWDQGVGNETRELAQALGLSLTVAELLIGRGHADPEEARRFLEPKLADLTRPDQMADRAQAAERLKAAIAAGERVAVFGDYDCDGITAAAVMTEVLRAFGGQVVVLLANRFGGGYGVTPEATERIIESGATLLVTCDCGSSDHRALADLRGRGVESIVIDHHLVPDEPLPALAFLNPHRPDCGFPYKGLASCGLALSIGAALRAALGAKLDLRELLDLVAIGTVADVAPLDGDNRALVRAGLGVLRSAKRPGVRALLELANIDATSPITAEDIAFRLAPRLNAPGRMGAPDLALELLLSRTHDDARAVAARIEQLSDERKSVQQTLLAEAIEEIERDGYAERSAIVIGREGWSHGIVGIVAGRLAERYTRPVIVVGFEQGRGRGSVRGPKGARLFDAVQACEAALIRFGGHQAAAGVELEPSRLDELRERFEHACSNAESSDPDSGFHTPPARFVAGDDPAHVLRDLWKLEPCGHSNPAPRLAISARVVSAREVKGGHLKLELEVDGGHRLAAFGVGLGERAASIVGQVELVGSLRPDRWRGGDAVEVRIDQIDG
jgi:single-stranded-DNA-specific exonuclease